FYDPSEGFFRLLSQFVTARDALQCARPAGVVVNVLSRLPAGKDQFGGIHHDDKIAGIHMKRENGFMFAAKELGHFHSQAANRLAFAVDHKPLALYFFLLGRDGFHWLTPSSFALTLAVCVRRTKSRSFATTAQDDGHSLCISVCMGT